MMLRTLLPSLSQRYAFAGSAFGAALPFIGFTTEALFAERGYDFVSELRDPVHAVLLTLPVISGAVFYQFGKTRELLSARLRARERSARNLLKLSMHDGLTGLPNRRALEQDVARMVRTRQNSDARPVLLLLDLDKFKNVNDTLGHDAGDELLQQFATRLQSILASQGRLYRLGGDEFVVTIPNGTRDSDIERLCRLIESHAEEPFLLRAGRALTGVSIGVSFVEEDDKAMQDVLKRADLALYIAKDIPGSAHAFHTEGLARLMLEQMQLQQDIAAGLRESQFFLEYQPIVNSDDGALGGFEALVRWHHPERGVVTPDGFLQVAECCGQIALLGRWVAAEAIREAASWPTHITVSINLSGGEFRDPGFVRHIRDELQRHGLAPERLTLEITETALAIDAGPLRPALGELRDLGVRVALDDFGIGYSSIDNLRRFPVDALKVDRSFAFAMVDGGREKELVDIMMKLGRVFGLTSVLEGIENERQMDLAVKLGATALQGFHISRPVSADTVRKLILSAGFTPQKPALAIGA